MMMAMPLPTPNAPPSSHPHPHPPHNNNNPQQNPIPLVHPIQLLLQEQSKFMVAIKELQGQVQTLQDFRSRVLMAFPQLENNLGGGGGSTGNLGNLVPLQHRKSTGGTKGNRVLPSVQVAVSSRQQQTATNRGTGSSSVRQVLLKPQTIRHGREHDADAASSRHPSVERAGKKFVVVAQGRNWLRLRPFSTSDAPTADSELDDSDDELNSTSDSLRSVTGHRDKLVDRNKGALRGKNDGTTTTGVRQDSGFSTDGRVSHHQDVSSSDVRWSKQDEMETDDELMRVLEAIGQKSVFIRSQMERAAAKSCHGISLADIGLKTEDVLAEVDRLRAEREQLLERLVLAESDRMMYGREVLRLRESLVEREAVKSAFEERMEVMSAERERLRTEVHRLHTQFSPKNNNGGNGGSQPKRETQVAVTATGIALKPTRSVKSNGPISLPDRLGHTKLKVHMDKSKISAILGESRTLELQRQLLVSVLRTEVLRSQMEQNATEWQRKASSWRTTEASLNAEAGVARQSNVQLQIKVHQMETELQAERSKRQVLERALQAAYKDLTHTNSNREQPSSSALENNQPAIDEEKKFADLNSPTWKETTYGKVSSSSPIKGSSRFTTLSRLKEVEKTAIESDFVRQDSAESDEEQCSSILLDTFARRTIEDAETLAMTSSSPPSKRQLTLENSGEIGLHQSKPIPPPDIVSRNNSSSQMTMRWRQSLVELNGEESLDTTSSNKKLTRRLQQRATTTTTSTPKTKSPYYYVPRYSHSAEDIRDSDWDWTYDVTNSGTQQQPSRLSYVVLHSQGMLQSRALSEART